MILTGLYDHAVLLALGAKRVSDVQDEAGVITGVDVSPDVDVTGYDAAAAAHLAAARLAAGRARRDQLLAASDYTQLGDCPVGKSTRPAWATYRQALRDLPDTGGDDPDLWIWPTPPGS